MILRAKSCRGFGILAASVCFSSCTEPLAIGSHEGDGQALSESANLQHLQTAFQKDMTVAEMLADVDALRFATAPDPSALLRATATLDDARSASNGAPLRILVQNVALLDAKIFGFMDYAETPFLEERRGELPHLYIGAGFDILLFQEVWVDEDLERFIETAEEAGYAAFASSRDGYNDGLLTLIHSSLIEDNRAPSSDAMPYHMQDGLEHFPGPGIKRGYLWVRFHHPTLGEISVFNTHMQAYASNWKHRMMQARELGIAIDDHATENELVFVGGDLNSGPYYAMDTWAHPDGTEETNWWKNAIAYPLLLEYGKLQDLAVMGRTIEDAASDVVLGGEVPNLPELALEVPMGDAAYCDSVPHHTFSATDCNSLYFQQYAGTEFPARLDHLHARDPQGRIRVVQHELVFTEEIEFGGILTEPSDHYGVKIDMVVDGQE